MEIGKLVMFCILGFAIVVLLVVVLNVMCLSMRQTPISTFGVTCLSPLVTIFLSFPIVASWDYHGSKVMVCCVLDSGFVDFP